MDFFRLFDGHGAIMWVIEAHTGVIAFANQSAHSFYGYPNGSLIGMNIDQINTLTPEEVAREREAAAAEQRNFFVFRHRLFDGTVRSVEVRSYPIILADTAYLYSIITDITERLALEAEHQRTTRTGFMLFGVLVVLLMGTGTILYSYSRREATSRRIHEASDRKYRGMISNVPGMVYRCKLDRTWTMEYVSQGSFALTGYEPYELIDNKVIDFNSVIHPDYREMLWEKWQSIVERGGTFNAEYRIICKNGQEKWVWEQGHVVFDAGGDTTALDGLIMDISDQIKTSAYIKTQEAKLWATLVSVGDGVIATDAEGRIEFINPVAESLTGWSASDAVGQPFDEIFTTLNASDAAPIRGIVEQALSSQIAQSLPENSILVSKDGIRRDVSDSVAPIRDATGHIVGVVVVFKDSTEEKNRQREIEYLSFRDYLTGLYNRRFYEEELGRLDTARNLPLSIIMADVNALKTINDAFGHDAGDEMLIKTGAVLRRECRADDIIARYGGDEFIVLLPKTSEEAAESLANRITERVGRELVSGIPITLSVGWATKTEASEHASDTLNRAEDLLYRQKVTSTADTRNQIIHIILRTLFLRSPHEAKHSEQVRELCRRVAGIMQLNQRDRQHLASAGEVHDIGKIACSLSILHKPEPLSDEERSEIRRHAEIGYRILATSGDFAPIADAILAHHEQWDGKGYPKGLAGEDVPLFARILAVVDAYSDMVSARPHRAARTHEQAMAELQRCAGTQFDPEIVARFAEAMNSMQP